MITGINHITLSVRGIARSLAFYRDVLGCRPLARWPAGAYLLAGNQWLALVVDPAVRAGPLLEYRHVAFSVPPEEFAALAAREGHA
ncbi:MAG TPA: VOC family protein [Roseiflexaceae bacterium]|nr:VOC family protein [Roseiflexaceae bacterium]